MTGWVYILANDSMPGLLKIGYTIRTPQERARELSSATGVPKPFRVAYAWETKNPKALEASVHIRLDRFRVNGNREFFYISVSKAKAAIQKSAKPHRWVSNIIWLVVFTCILSIGLVLGWPLFYSLFYEWNPFSLGGLGTCIIVIILCIIMFSPSGRKRGRWKRF
jgi:T5orf172 domain